MDVLKFSNLEGFGKVDYVSKELRLTRRGVARILELKTDDVSSALDNGFVAENLAEHDKVHERIYNVLRLYSYLLKMSDYKIKPLRSLWRENNFWDSAIVKPPWYENGMKDYLFRKRLKGLESCLDWIQKY